MTDETRDMICDPMTPPIVQARPVGHPLGPLIVWQRVEAPLIGRLYALVVAAMCMAALGVAFWTSPSHDHLGTHRQLGLPPCAFVAVTGFPCPTCGMTTAYAYFVRGRFLDAARSSVFGLLLAIGTAGIAVAAVGCAITGRYPNLNWYRVDAVKLVYYGALMLVLSWGLKIALGLHDGSLPVK